ncbi:DNA mismatch repair protein MutS [Desulfolutivibrio sulfoxidireducens]|uniref:DNA mismatch repair protein MutS n=1 Tax=Desulfolutivibrio sulfoxidireducens TaxID=2773299 RepID=UPI00159D3B8B|nr:DNA mismatch repair protein MutS [Desulfolutivibrio sulfoxidireducens]QLA16458.1 DNA mismatch repair protein MutS [Desulfolutivibrio sulfoxidireducens]
MTGVKLTPMFEQYLRVKSEYPETLLFYRMGDFYELFFEDAITAARELQITLTSRNPGAESPVPMAGVPHHAAEAYLGQLLEKGYRIAVCDQIEDPKQAKGLVKRAVTRVLTPGTTVEDASLTAKEHNYLAALFWDEKERAGGLCWADFSTGEWSGLFSREEARLWQWTLKMSPRELLVPDGQEPPREVKAAGLQISRYPARPHFDLAPARERIKKAQGISDLAVLDVADKPPLVRAMGAILSYLIQTQKREITHLSPFRPVNLSRHLLLDEITERNLEIFRRLDGKKGPGTLIHVLDRTTTPMGGRLLESLLRQPWLEMGPILETQEAVAFFADHAEPRAGVRRALDAVYDLERLASRIVLNRCAPKDFVALRQSLGGLADLRLALTAGTDAPPHAPRALAGILEAWDDLADVRDLLTRALVDAPPPLVTEGGLFLPGYHPELDELMGLTEHGEARLTELLDEERQGANLPRLKLGFNRVFGYYFELSKSGGYVPEHFERRQTLADRERYVTPRLKELESRLLEAGERRKTLEYTLFKELRESVAACRERLAAMARAVARVDVWQGLAETAVKLEWTRPEIHPGIEIDIRAGRHPVVEAAAGGDYIPNDLILDDDRRMLLITGPNMAGKSTVLRQTAIIAVLAQIGSFVPAARARVGLTDRVFCRVGASDNLAMGQSTFMVEMSETARILRQAGKRSLVVLDEIGRGTSTFDGLALAWAVAEALALREEGGVRTLFATHYHELTKLEGMIPGVRNYNIAIKEWRGDIIFLRRLVPGPADRSYGVEVARLAGVPKAVVRRAREILGDLEKSRDAAGTAAGPGTKSAGQPALPGLFANPDQAEAGCVPCAAHPLARELAALDIDRLTPLEALRLLGDFKSRYGGENGA